MILAQQLETGDVRYIRLSRYENTKVTFTLRNFYSKESRVKALLDLGNLYSLRATPYGKYNTKDKDMVHCIAGIRDYNESRGRNIAKYTSLSELQNIEGHKFLYKDGAWHYFDGVEFSTLLPFVIAQPESNKLEKLEMRTLSKDSDISYQRNDFKSWNEIVEYATTECKPIFIFRGDKLITTINHPKNK